MNSHTQTFLWINILWAIIIFILCAVPGEAIPNPHFHIPHLDKVVHFGMFFIMSLLLWCGFEKSTAFSGKKICGIAILTAFIYGGLIEILQQKFFNRNGDLADLAADVAGGIVGCLCYPFIKKLFSGKKQK